MKVERETYRGWKVEDEDGDEFYVYITEKGMFCSCHIEPDIPCKHMLAVKEFEISNRKYAFEKAFNNYDGTYIPQV